MNGCGHPDASRLPLPVSTPTTEETPELPPPSRHGGDPCRGDGQPESSSSRDHVAAECETGVEGSAAVSRGEQAGPPDRPQADASGKQRSRSGTKTSANGSVRRLSASQMQELTASPESLPVAAIPARPAPDHPWSAVPVEAHGRQSAYSARRDLTDPSRHDNPLAAPAARPVAPPRTVSTPPLNRRQSGGQTPTDPPSKRRNSSNPVPRPVPLDLARHGSFSDLRHKNKIAASGNPDAGDPTPPSPIPPAIPLPPMSIPTVLQLELAAERPSPLYIHHSHTSDLPYESMAVKFERLKNFLLLPSYFERTMVFGVLACLDAWLWTFTILPMRFLGAFGILARWWGYVIRREVNWLIAFVWHGLGRLWERTRRGRPARREVDGGSGGGPRSRSRSHGISGGGRADGTGNGLAAANNEHSGPVPPRADKARRHSFKSAARSVPKEHAASPRPFSFGHRRTKSIPSSLTPVHKADILQGLVIISSSFFLMHLDASRMYHFIRAQSAMKLYVIYNVLEVGDRLLSALGQDIFECLFSSETLSRNSSGRSKLLLPFGMFLLSLAYNISHSVTLFYEVTTLNVAVNSYSNALLTLLISNQFVEIKSSVFKRFEKENAFQLTCADIVERFQLWIMLFIIGMRNVIEVGGLSVPGAGTEIGGDDHASRVPLHSASVLPASFTIIPPWLLSGEVLSPFLVVIGSEMFVDWIKHAYINKFNNVKPTLYARILDILSKDYYTSAFATPSLTRRLGVPLIPLSCLFIRASVQTYHMFLATHLPTPPPPSTQTSLSVESSTVAPTSSPAVVAALDKIDAKIRGALGRAVHGYPSEGGGGRRGAAAPAWNPFGWTGDDAVAAVTMVVVFLLVFLALLVVKLLLGMLLLRYARDRYARMKAREHAVSAGRAERDALDARGRRVGGYGHVEVGDDRRRWIYADDPDGLRKAREKERRAERGSEKEKDMGGVMRYEMVAKRIW